MSTTRITGRVKWFNSKAGYGFITACDGELVDKDIFVHYSSIKSDASHYKYLTQGEYVDFSITKPVNEKHEFHAVDISGVKGGPILCETRRQSALVSRTTPNGGDKEEPREVSTEVTTTPVRKNKSRPSAYSSQKSYSVATSKVSDTEGFTPVKKRGSSRAKNTSQ